MAGVQLALTRCRGRLSGDYDKDIQVHNDMAQLGGMASDLIYAMNLLRDGATPAQLAAEAKELAMSVAEIPDGARPAIPAGMGEIRGRLAEALATFPPRQREVFILVEGRGMTAAEAAQIMHVSRQAAATHLSRARDRLQRLQNE